MPMSQYPNGFNDGLLLRNMPITVAYPGKIFWLNNSSVLPQNGIAGSDALPNDGSYYKPYATLAKAVSQCVANRGDIIMVMAGHAETYSSATAISINIANVLVVGLGQGDSRPTFTLDTGTSSTINVTANNIGFCNCIFLANFAAIVSCFTLTTATCFTLSDCEFRDKSSILNFKYIVNVGATSNAANGLYIERSNWYGLGATSGSAYVNMAGTNDRVVIKDSYIAHKATSTAGLMPIATGKVVTNLLVSGNTINLVGSSAATTGIIITTDGTTNSGMISRNFIQSLDDTTPILVTASSGFLYSQNYYSSNADKSGFLLPALDS